MSDLQLSSVRYRLQGWDDETVFLNVEELSEYHLEGEGPLWIPRLQIALDDHPEIEKLVTNVAVALLQAKGVNLCPLQTNLSSTSPR